MSRPTNHAGCCKCSLTWVTTVLSCGEARQIFKSNKTELDTTENCHDKDETFSPLSSYKREFTAFN